MYLIAKKSGETGISMSPARSSEAIDILDYLPHSTLFSYKAGETVYTYNQPASHLYLVVHGRVQVARVTPEHGSLILDVYRTDEIFGESALLGLRYRPDVAVTLENADLMMWTAEEIRKVIRLRPQVGMALGQILAQRLIDFGNRIESFAADGINQRLARTLIRLAERFGNPAKDGSVHVTGLGHQILSEYVVSSRSSVTHWMKYFRRKGLLDYNRNRIRVFPPALEEWLKVDVADPGRTIPCEPLLRREQSNGEPRPLSRREVQIMDLVAEGLKNKEIADRLRISKQTVKNHLQNIFEKLAAVDRRQAARRLARMKQRSKPLPMMTSPPVALLSSQL
jgi:CRP-like cAMP-binding protein/DNA-binding CsgD family transcriptional regulator